MKTLSVRKLYVDSRYLSSGDPSSFEYELPETVELPKDTVAYVTEFTCVNGWDTVNDSNMFFYIAEERSDFTYKGRRIALAHKPHDSETLRSDIQAALNGSGKTVAGSYTVTRVPSAGNGSSGLAASYRYFEITLNGGGKFYIPVEEQLKDPHWYSSSWINLYLGDPYTPSQTNSTNELLSFSMSGLATSATSGFIDLRSKHSLFVHSPSFGNYTSIGPRGVRTILQKIPVHNAYGGLTFYEHSGHPADYIEVSSTTIRTMKFELRDARGNLVNLNGGHWSMTIVFGERPM